MKIDKDYAYNFLLEVAVQHELTSGSNKCITQRLLKERNLKKKHMIKLAALCSALSKEEEYIKEQAKKIAKERKGD